MRTVTKAGLIVSALALGLTAGVGDASARVSNQRAHPHPARHPHMRTYHRHRHPRHHHYSYWHHHHYNRYSMAAPGYSAAPMMMSHNYPSGTVVAGPSQLPPGTYYNQAGPYRDRNLYVTHAPYQTWAANPGDPGAYRTRRPYYAPDHWSPPGASTNWAVPDTMRYNWDQSY